MMNTNAIAISMWTQSGLRLMKLSIMTLISNHGFIANFYRELSRINEHESLRMNAYEQFYLTKTKWPLLYCLHISGPDLSC